MDHRTPEFCSLLSLFSCPAHSIQTRPISAYSYVFFLVKSNPAFHSAPFSINPNSFSANPIFNPLSLHTLQSRDALCTFVCKARNTKHNTNNYWFNPVHSSLFYLVHSIPLLPSLIQSIPNQHDLFQSPPLQTKMRLGFLFCICTVPTFCLQAHYKQVSLSASAGWKNFKGIIFHW